jgi:hypothetical protein
MGEIPKIVEALLMPTFLFLKQAMLICGAFRRSDESEDLLNY